MTYLFAVLLITACSVIHDGDYQALLHRSLGKAHVVIVQIIIMLAITGAMGASFGHSSMTISIKDYPALIAALSSIGIFWGVFRRGWQARTELNAIHYRTQSFIDDIATVYPWKLGIVPRFITIQVLKLPCERWHRRIQSGLIAILWTAPISAIPVLVG